MRIYEEHRKQETTKPIPPTPDPGPPLTEEEETSLRDSILTALAIEPNDYYAVPMVARLLATLDRERATAAALREELAQAQLTWPDPITGEPLDILGLYTQSIERGRQAVRTPAQGELLR